MMQEFVQTIKDTVNEMLGDIHTAIPGRIESVDLETGLASVMPVMKKKLRNGQTMDYPLITGVPIVFPQGAGQSVSIVFPVNQGDTCLLVISEQALDYWLFGRETGTDLPFDITNAICIPGLFQRAPEALASANSQNSVVVTGNVIINGSLNVSGAISAGSINGTNVSADSSGTE